MKKHTFTHNHSKHTETGWVNFTIDGKLKGQAKIYGEPSEGYGINDGRVSKLWIFNPDTKKEIYNYDRGHDTQTCDQELIDATVAWLEATF